MQSIAQPPARALPGRRAGIVPWLAVAGVAAFLAIGQLRPLSGFDAPGLLALLNFLFLTVAPLTAALLAFRAYERSGLLALLAVGGGMAALGLGCGILPATLLTTVGGDSGIVVHNTTMLLVGLANTLAVVAASLGLTLGSSRRRHVVVVYAVAILAVAGVLAADLLHLVPTFWAADGSTTARGIVLRFATLLFIVAAFGWWQFQLRGRLGAFLSWYVPGLVSFALSLLALVAISSLGDLLVWGSRVAQYVGALLLLIGVVRELRPSVGPAALIGGLSRRSTDFGPVMEASADAVLALGRRGQVSYWNPATERLFGIGAAEAMEQDPVPLLLGETVSAEASADLDDLLAGSESDEPRSGTLELRGEDGKPFPARVTVFRSPSDRRLRVIVVGDLRPTVRRERALEDAVTDRTHELEAAVDSLRAANDALATVNSKLESSRDELEAANEALTRANAAKDDFLGLVSHELRTPITSIVAATSLMRTHPEIADDNDLLSDLDGEAARLSAIVDNLLTLARLDAGRDADAEPVQLARVVESAVRRLGRQHPHRQMRVDLVRPAVVEGNAEQLAMVVGNFLSNALKYSPLTAPVDVRIDGDGEMARVTVLDSGVGVDPAEIPHLFEPFHRGSTVGDVSGIGIGLTVCKRIIEAHHGTLGAEPRSDGPGTAFWFTLPVAPQEDGEETPGPVAP